MITVADLYQSGRVTIGTGDLDDPDARGRAQGVVEMIVSVLGLGRTAGTVAVATRLGLDHARLYPLGSTVGRP